MRHLQELLKEDEEKGDERDEYLRFEFGSVASTSSSSEGGGTLVVLETNALQEIDKEVREEHAIQNSFYFPPSSSERKQKEEGRRGNELVTTQSLKC